MYALLSSFKTDVRARTSDRGLETLQACELEKEVNCRNVLSPESME